jgi:hypothetical protein
MRVLFLDFDGVLHPAEGASDSTRFRWLQVLEQMLDGHRDVQIVVHSSWRYEYSDRELRELLGGLGSRFIGSVPRLPREGAIEMVLQANRGRITSHLVLDDDAREFTAGRLNLLRCEPSLGVSDPNVQSAITDWLHSTGAIRAVASRASKLPKGYGEFVLYLDFDGVLHHENVLWHPARGAYAGAPGFELFEHAALLEELLVPYPSLRIVLSTSWVRQYGCYGASKRLPAGLRARVIGATYHSRMNLTEFLEKPRGQQVHEDVLRRCPRGWLALDDVDEGWPAELRSRVVITDERLGISAPDVADAIRGALLRMHRDL